MQKVDLPQLHAFSGIEETIIMAFGNPRNDSSTVFNHSNVGYSKS